MSKDLILIVDDSKLERTVLCDILQSDYSVWKPRTDRWQSRYWKRIKKESV